MPIMRTQSVLNGIPTRSMGTIVVELSFLTLRVGMHWVTLRVTILRRAAHSRQYAERPGRHTHAEHGYDSCGERAIELLLRLQAIEVGEVLAHVGDAAQQFGALFRRAQGGDVDDQRYRGLLGLVVGLAVFRGPERLAVLQ